MLLFVTTASHTHTPADTHTHTVILTNCLTICWEQK